MKLKDVFEKSVQFFKEKKFETARLDAEIILSHVLKIDRLQIYLKYEQPLSENEIQICRDAVRRRAQGEPVAYIIQEKGFYGENFSVGAGVLVPRPETELIVEEALKFIKENNIQYPLILDLGAGSGCIGFSILKNCSSAKLISVEKSEAAFKYLKLNQNKLNLQERSQLHLNDVMSFNTQHSFDLIVANPPYIDQSDVAIEQNVKKFEPSDALFSKNNGLNDLFDWSRKYKSQLKKPGLILFEMGYQQGQKVKEHFEGLNQFSKVQILKDLSGLDRAIKALNNN